MGFRGTKKPANPKAGRLIALLLLGVLGWELWTTWELLPQLPNLIGHDFTTYRDAAGSWLHGTGFYPPSQLAGPYEIREREILYPPVALLLFAPFTVLPAVLWWTPVIVTAWVVWSHRPKPWAWIAILTLLVLPITSFTYSATLDMIYNGNPVMWSIMVVALATRYPVFGPFAFLKPTPLLIPFGLVGVRSRAWWIGLALFALACLAFAPMWPDYLRVLGNARGGGLVYSPASVFPMLIPVVAWLGSGLRDPVDPDRARGDVARAEQEPDRRERRGREVHA